MMVRAKPNMNQWYNV